MNDWWIGFGVSISLMIVMIVVKRYLENRKFENLKDFLKEKTESVEFLGRAYEIKPLTMNRLKKLWEVQEITLDTSMPYSAARAFLGCLRVAQLATNIPARILKKAPKEEVERIYHAALDSWGFLQGREAEAATVTERAPRDHVRDTTEAEPLIEAAEK